MRLICFWCFLLGAAVRAQNDYYAPQTFRQQGHHGVPCCSNLLSHPGEPQTTKWVPTRAVLSGADGPAPAQSTSQSWTPNDNKESWRSPLMTNVKPEPWRLPYGAGVSKEQQAAILHHKQALTSEGAFRFEYASDNGLAAGEQIEPDGSRVGAYQYKDPSGQLVKLKYRAGKDGFRQHIEPDGSRVGTYQYNGASGQLVKLKYHAGKDGFQILEGSHLPKSPEPVVPVNQDNHYQSAYAQQKQQYDLQQQYNQQRPDESQKWRDEQSQDGPRAAGGQYFVQNTNWRPQGGAEDDGQYRDNEVDNKGPHSFGEGYALPSKDNSFL